MPFLFKANTGKISQFLTQPSLLSHFICLIHTKLVTSFILKDFYNQVIYLDGIATLSNLSNPKAQTNSLIRTITPQCHWQLCRKYLFSYLWDTVTPKVRWKRCCLAALPSCKKPHVPPCHQLFVAFSRSLANKLIPILHHFHYRFPKFSSLT